MTPDFNPKKIKLIKQLEEMGKELNLKVQLLEQLEKAHNELYFVLMAVLAKLPDHKLELTNDDFIKLERMWRIGRTKTETTINYTLERV